jgi:histidinol-phosphatase
MAEERRMFLDFALTLAKAAQNEIMPRYRNCVADLKADGSEVTEADRQAERVMRRLIAERYPDHDVLGEEFGSGQGNTRYRWVLDPIDGTLWFALGVPGFSTLIALLEGDEPIVGVIHYPALNETVYAAKGLGCWLKIAADDPLRLQVGAGVALSDAFLSSTGVHCSDIRACADWPRYNLSALMRRAHRFEFANAFQYALVCRGKLHAAIDTRMQPWDSAAMVVCVEEAGGVATTIEGRREGIVWGGNLVASCDRALHDEVLDALQSGR